MVEILLAVIILAILGGGMLFALGPSTDSAVASRIAGELDSLRMAALAFSQTQSWNRDASATAISDAHIAPYLTKSIDSPFEVRQGTGGVLIGFPNHSKITAGVARKLASTGDGVLRDQTGAPYTDGTAIYVRLR